MLTCIAVDDEPLALTLIGAFIAQTPFLRQVGAYSSAIAALRALHEPGVEAVDVVFLDIQMPDLNGLELARVLAGHGAKAPKVIFTTAFNQFAVEGYRVDALDYLLKPFGYDEFLRAAEKASAWWTMARQAPSRSAEEPLPNPDALVATGPHALTDAIFLRVEYQLVRVELADILYLEGLKDYVKVFRRSETRPLLSLTTLKALEDRLPAARFLRLHRSFIVNLDRLTALSRNAVQIGEVTIPVSLQYKDSYQQLFDRWT
jgi:two-component system, LytTR family, response regulator LytT